MLIPVFPLDPKGSRRPWGDKSEGWCPLQDVCATIEGLKNAPKSDSQSGLSRMESVCAGEEFYQRQTLTGIPVWDCPSNSCVPQEAQHKKQPKTPEDISHVASRLTGSTSTYPRGFLFHNSGSSFKRTWHHGRGVQWSTGTAARASGCCARTRTWWHHTARVRFIYFYLFI